MSLNIYSKAGADAAFATAEQGAKADASDVATITLTAPLALTIPAGFPAGQVYRVTLTQDGTGGHTVTYGGQPVTVDLTAGASTQVEIWPDGEVAYPATASLLSTYATRLPLAGRSCTPSGQIAWTANPSLTFYPRSIGVDGYLYFTYLNTLLMRSNDPTLAVRTSGPDFASKTPSRIIHATRTTAGYVVVTNDAATDVANVWFCPQSAGFSTNLADWTMVQDMKAVTEISIAKQRVIAGVSWLVIGEYKTARYPSAARKLWLSRDGGQTWTAIRDTLVTDYTVNSHWHAALIMATGRIWASSGDGVNSWFGYTDDCGASWIPVTMPATHPLYGASAYQQPTVMLDMGETIAVTPDRGNFVTGAWAVDPDTGETAVWSTLPSGEIAHTQYGSAAAQRGKEAYISFPDQGSGSGKTYILGTGDGGRSWHVVSTIDTTGGILSKIVGPDSNGRVYMQPSSAIPTYGGGIMVGTLPNWS